VEVCRNQDDGHGCSYAGAPAGSFYCRDGLCVLAECGDEVHGGNEVCDDGNNVSGDGCSEDCLSLEECGNSYVDVALGEGCDDGNQKDHDGCTSACVMEYPAWHEVWATIPGIFGMGVASDVDNGRVVVYGGVYPDGEFLDAAWSFDGSSWERIHSELQPPARMDPAITYDASRQRVVLYGGWSGTGSLDDTWELQGESWQEVVTPHAPPARSGAPMVHDSARGRVVLYGGELADRTVLCTTWEYDGADWQEIQVADPPPARRYHGMAYDSLRSRVVLFGGSYGSPEWHYLGDTWEYDGQTWTELTPVTSPPPRDNHTLVWDPDRQQVVLFGGMGPTGLVSDTWELDGAQWVQLDTPIAPNPRGQFALAHDSTSARLVLVGGTPGAYQAFDDMWQLQGNLWTRVESRTPRRRLAAGMVYDDARGRIVMYGGVDGFPDGVMLDDTWEYDGHTWQRIRTATSPGGRAGHALVFDSERQRAVLFGGIRSNSFFDCADDHWEYDGLDWEPVMTSPRPSARGVAAFAYDPIRGVMVLFGGICAEILLADTWEYDGVSWSEVVPTGDGAATWPQGRVGAAMAWDPDRQRIVLFGGKAGDDTNLDDTWEYDGVGWRLIEGQTAPTPRAGHALLYNAARRGMTVLGGMGAGATTDTWELRGSTWFQVSVTNPPSDRFGAAAAYFPMQDAVLLFGGFDSRGLPLDAWLRYRFDGASPDEVCYGGIDEDGDGLVDCVDPDCEGRPCGFMQVCLLGECY
jgi:cysteine-rich repeat protein